MFGEACEKCGGLALVHLSSLNIKLCAECKHENPWNLKAGQQSIFGGTVGHRGGANTANDGTQPTHLPDVQDP